MSNGQIVGGEPRPCNAVKQSDLQALRDTIAALEAENTRLRACIEALEADRDTNRRKIADLAGQIDSLKRENDRLRWRTEGLEAEHARLKAEYGRSTENAAGWSPTMVRDSWPRMRRMAEPSLSGRVIGGTMALSW